MLNVECTNCARKGRYHVQRLIKGYGRRDNMSKWLSDLKGDCPKRDAHSLHERCACCVLICRRCYDPLSIVSPAANMRNNSAPKWSKLWTDIPRPGDHIGAYSTEQLERMNQEFTAVVERAFRVGGESEMAANATYDLRRR